jgi:hypothetical protein
LRRSENDVVFLGSIRVVDFRPPMLFVIADVDDLRRPAIALPSVLRMFPDEGCSNECLMMHA